MTFISLPIGTLTLDVTSLIAAHPGLIYDIGGHALAHALYSHIRRRHHSGLSRREMRKTANRKRRWFVDNIIMHHKRLHDRNRAVLISNARSRALAMRNTVKKEPLSPQQENSLHRDQDPKMKWRNAINLKEKGKELRGRSDARRLRARSKWLTIMEPR